MDVPIDIWLEVTSQREIEREITVRNQCHLQQIEREQGVTQGPLMREIHSNYGINSSSKAILEGSVLKERKEYQDRRKDNVASSTRGRKPPVELSQGNDIGGEHNIYDKTPPATKTYSPNQQGEQETDAATQDPSRGTTATPTPASQEQVDDPPQKL